VATQHDIEINDYIYGAEADLYCRRPAISLGNCWQLTTADMAGASADVAGVTNISIFDIGYAPVGFSPRPPDVLPLLW
jgi:hypothetical protein